VRARALVAFLLVLLTGCQMTSADESVLLDDLPAIAQKTSLAARRFEYQLVVAGRTVSMEGRVEDDYRYEAQISLDGSPVYREVVYDDARYLQLQDSSWLPPSLVAGNEAFAELMTGGWVVDPLGAPPEFGGERAQPVPLAASFLLERVRFPEQLPEILKLTFKEYNIRALYYMPRDDKFPEHLEDGKRYDRVPDAYDPNAVTVTFDQLRPFFEYISIWGKPTHIGRVERLIELPPRGRELYEELYTQLERAGSRTLVNILKAPEGRRFAETYRFWAEEEIEIQRPDGATPVELAPAIAALGAALLQAGPGAAWTPLMGLPS